VNFFGNLFLGGFTSPVHCKYLKQSIDLLKAASSTRSDGLTHRHFGEAFEGDVVFYALLQGGYELLYFLLVKKPTKG